MSSDGEEEEKMGEINDLFSQELKNGEIEDSPSVSSSNADNSIGTDYAKTSVSGISSTKESF